MGNVLATTGKNQCLKPCMLPRTVLVPGLFDKRLVATFNSRRCGERSTTSAPSTGPAGDLGCCTPRLVGASGAMDHGSHRSTLWQPLLHASMSFPLEPYRNAARMSRVRRRGGPRCPSVLMARSLGGSRIDVLTTSCCSSSSSRWPHVSALCVHREVDVLRLELPDEIIQIAETTFLQEEVAVEKPEVQDRNDTDENDIGTTLPGRQSDDGGDDSDSPALEAE